MNNLDDILNKNSPQPKRKISSNFTEAVIVEIKSRPKQSWLQKLAINTQVLKLSRSAVALFMAILLISGTAVAIAVWPEPKVTPGITKLLPSGNHIVGIDAQNCQYFKALDGAPLKTTSEKLYYEIRQGSRLTDEQLINTLQGICEENISDNAVSAVIKRLPKNLPDGFSTEAFTITAITENSMTVTLDPHYDPAVYTTKSRLTFTHFSNNLLTYNQGSKVQYESLRSGDTIKMIVQNTAKEQTESTQPFNPLNNPDKIVILALIKIPALTADPSTFYSSLGKDFVRAEPCSTSPTGFCRAYEFNKY